jgi:hypothetical protein
MCGDCEGNRSAIPLTWRCSKVDFPLMEDGTSTFDGKSWVWVGFEGARSPGTAHAVLLAGVSGDIISGCSFFRVLWMRLRKRSAMGR